MMRCLQNAQLKHPCMKIVQWQKTHKNLAYQDHQLPEPWSGDIERAPLLFISSNPSLSTTEMYPSLGWSDDEIRDFFTNRFDKWMKDGSRFMRWDRTFPNKKTPFNRDIMRYAGELLGSSNIKPGKDYAITEVVHCKSESEHGVAGALKTCAANFLLPIMKISGAKCVIIVGSKAKSRFNSLLKIEASAAICSPLEVGGKKRLLVYLKHPSARAKKGPLKELKQEEVDRIRAFINQ